MPQFLDTESETSIRHAIASYGPYNFLVALSDIMRDMVNREQLLKGKEYYSPVRGQGVVDNAVCEAISRQLKTVAARFEGLEEV